MDNTHEFLGDVRRQIDDVDKQLILYLAKRFELSRTIGLMKRAADAPVHQPDRAKEVQDRYVNLGAAHGIDTAFVRDLFHLIHEESCRMQEEHGHQSMEL